MNAFRSEVTKLTTLRLTWGILVAAVVLGGAFGGGNVYVFGKDADVRLTDVAVAPVQLTWFLVVVVAVLASASEFQHRTVLTTLLTTPSRGLVLLTKAAAAALMGTVVTVGATAMSVLCGLVAALAFDVTVTPGSPSGWAGVAGGVVLGGLWGVFASALGLLTRSTALAVSALLVWKLVLEGLVPVVTRNPGISDWTPGGAAAIVLHAGEPGSAPVVALLVVLGYAVAACAVAAGVFLARDPA